MLRKTELFKKVSHDFNMKQDKMWHDLKQVMMYKTLM